MSHVWPWETDYVFQVSSSWSSNPWPLNHIQNISFHWKATHRAIKASINERSPWMKNWINKKYRPVSKLFLGGVGEGGKLGKFWNFLWLSVDYLAITLNLAILGGGGGQMIPLNPPSPGYGPEMKDMFRFSLFNTKNKEISSLSSPHIHTPSLSLSLSPFLFPLFSYVMRVDTWLVDIVSNN